MLTSSRPHGTDEASDEFPWSAKLDRPRFAAESSRVRAIGQTWSSSWGPLNPGSQRAAPRGWPPLDTSVRVDPAARAREQHLGLCAHRRRAAHARDQRLSQPARPSAAVGLRKSEAEVTGRGAPHVLRLRRSRGTSLFAAVIVRIFSGWRSRFLVCHADVLPPTAPPKSTAAGQAEPEGSTHGSLPNAYCTALSQSPLADLNRRPLVAMQVPAFGSRCPLFLRGPPSSARRETTLSR